jgi:hypothetical protein
MNSKINTIIPVDNLLDLKHEWKVVAFRRNGEGNWHWNIGLMEIGSFKEKITSGHIVSVHRRDADGTRMLAKLRGRGG